MAVIILAVIAIIILMVVAIVGIIIWEYRRSITDIIDVRKHHKNKDSLLIDYYRLPDIAVMSQHKNWTDERLSWTDWSEEQIYRAGYLSTEKWMDDLRYMGVPVYVRLHNFRITDPAAREKPNRLTSSVMYNIYNNQTMKRNIAGMTKIQFATIDLKSLGVLVPIAIGVLVGVLYLMKVI